MKTMDMNFIEIKTKKSPTAKALKTITTEKLKPFYNTVYQLLKLRNKNSKPLHKVFLEIEDKVTKQMPQIVLKRRIAQQTLDFPIEKPLELKHFSNETFSSQTKKDKSVTKSYSLTKYESAKHEQKDKMSQKFDAFRKVSKTFSESTLNQKKKYNLLEQWHTIVDNHYQSLELEPRYMIDQRDDKDVAYQKKQYRYKVEANNYKWVENTLISNESEQVSMVRKEKSKFFIKKGTDLYVFKGINDTEIQECQEIIEQDPDLLHLSLNHTIETMNVPEVKTMYEFTKRKLSSLMSNYKTTRATSPMRPSPKKSRSLDRSLKKKQSNMSETFKQYENFKSKQDYNPETFKVGDRNSNFRTKEEKFNMLTKMKQNQKAKYTTKAINANLHKKTFLKLK